MSCISPTPLAKRIYVDLFFTLAHFTLFPWGSSSFNLHSENLTLFSTTSCATLSTLWILFSDKTKHLYVIIYFQTCSITQCPNKRGNQNNKNVFRDSKGAIVILLEINSIMAFQSISLHFTNSEFFSCTLHSLPLVVFFLYTLSEELL